MMAIPGVAFSARFLLLVLEIRRRKFRLVIGREQR